MNERHAFLAAVLVVILMSGGAVVSGLWLPGIWGVYEEVPFDVVSEDCGYGIINRTTYVISDEPTWESLWYQTHTNREPIPEALYVNFTCRFIVVVCMGERSSSGYRTEISRIVLANSVLLVYVDEFSPAPGSAVLAVFTYPSQVVSLPILDSHFTASFVYTTHVVS